MNNGKERCKQNIDHLNRIQGQIETLKDYIAQGKGCAEVAQLATSIAKSFDTLRIKTLEGFIINELLQDKEISPAKLETLKRILELQKK